MSFLVVVCAAENKWRCDGFMEERGEIGEEFSMELKGFLGQYPNTYLQAIYQPVV
ncbi:hypothetical protein Patl1_15735 [Pistacia atlantica]|uniref:Uncharacterized protein n=1 Tax=Pistacia atlantica TaxID=434234 RepID=A0ACC1B9J1_9ROSI|nr:hypothetical protein Patl1_15735 [Pistacia atlantica]